MGVKDDPETGWQKIESAVAWLELTTGWALPERTDMIANAVRTLVKGGLKDCGVRVKVARTSAQPDKPMPIELFPNNSSPLADFFDFIHSFQTTLKRERTEAGCGVATITSPPVSLPSLCGNKRKLQAVTIDTASTASAEQTPKRQDSRTSASYHFLLKNGSLTSEELKVDKGRAYDDWKRLGGSEKVCFPFLAGGAKCCANYNADKGADYHTIVHKSKVPNGFKMTNYIVGAKPRDLAA